MVPSVGPMELVILLVVVLLLFRAKRIPELAKSLGSSVRGFHKGVWNRDNDQVKKREGREKLPEVQKAQAGLETPPSSSGGPPKFRSLASAPQELVIIGLLVLAIFGSRSFLR